MRILMSLNTCVFFSQSFMPSVLAAQHIKASSEPAKILAIGDSLMAWHLISQTSISDAVATKLGEPVLSRAVAGAKIIHGLPISGALGLKISKQFRDESWDWVIMNGGGNDLFLGCGCGKCDRRMSRMISPNGAAGDIPSLVHKIRQTGARIVYIGYLRSPGVASVIDECRAHGNELEGRLARMATQVLMWANYLTTG